MNENKGKTIHLKFKDVIVEFGVIFKLKKVADVLEELHDRLEKEQETSAGKSIKEERDKGS